MIKFRYKRKDPAASSSPSTTATSSVTTVTPVNSVVTTTVATATTPQYLQQSATLPKSTPRNAIHSQTAQVVQHYQQQQQYQHCDSYNPKVVDAGYYLTNESAYHEMINRMKTESVHQQHYEYMSCINSVVVSFPGFKSATFGTSFRNLTSISQFPHSRNCSPSCRRVRSRPSVRNRCDEPWPAGRSPVGASPSVASAMPPSVSSCCSTASTSTCHRAMGTLARRPNALPTNASPCGSSSRAFASAAPTPSSFRSRR